MVILELVAVYTTYCERLLCMNRLFTHTVFLTIISVCLIVGSEAAPAKDTLTETQARKYIGHLVDALFVPPNHSGSYERDLQKFSQDITRLLMQRLGYRPFFSFFKTYTAKEINDGFLRESVVFIEQASFKAAKEALNKLFIPIEINEQVLVEHVVKKISGEVTHMINGSTFLEQGTLTTYFGVPLCNKVYDMLKQELKQKAAQASKPNIPSQDATEECPVCFETFSKSHESIFLNCGHCICKECLRGLYKTYNDGRTKEFKCPLCRATIAISDFACELWPPSAPPLDERY
jgi:RING-type zinc-finger